MAHVIYWFLRRIGEPVEEHITWHNEPRYLVLSTIRTVLLLNIVWSTELAGTPPGGARLRLLFKLEPLTFCQRAHKRGVLSYVTASNKVSILILVHLR